MQSPVACTNAATDCFPGQSCTQGHGIPDACNATDAGVDASTPSDGGTPSDASDAATTIDSGDAGACTTYSLTGTQSVMGVGGSTQPLGGGVLVDGMYTLSGNVLMYGTAINVANETVGVRISGGGTRFERIEMDSDMFTDARNQPMTASNGTLVLSAGCAGNEARMVNYDTYPSGQVQTLVLMWQRAGHADTTFVETYLSH
jgi:hypothetical protein